MRNFTFFAFALLLIFISIPTHASSGVPSNVDNSPELANKVMMANNMFIGQLYKRENYNSGGNMHDSFAIIFDPSYDNAFTSGDAVKPFNFDENIARVLEGRYLSIERREMPVDGEVYELFSNNYRHSDYTLVLTVKSMEHMVFFLDDAFTGESFMLNTGVHPYHFSVSNSEPASKSSSRFSIRATERAPFLLPYTNNFQTDTDLYNALLIGFQFDDANLQESEGNYLNIANGNVVSPKIDFATLEHLNLSFSMSTEGLGNGQKLSILVSNDNGQTYDLLEQIDAPSNYTSYNRDIDVSALNGTEGRIKLEMTDGTGSIRLRDFSLKELTEYVFNNGSWSPVNPNGVSTLDDNIIIENGSATLNAPTFAKNITINENAILNIESVLTIYGDISSNGELVFISNATTNGELAPVPNTSNISGNITVQQYMQHKRSYRMVSSAVTTTTSIHENWQEGATSNTDNPNPGFGTHITGSTTDQTNGFDGTITGNPSMFTVNVNSQMFEAVSNTDTNKLNAGEPYLLFVRGDRSTDLGDDVAAGSTVLRATGSLLTGPTSQSFNTASAGDMVMFGNPYQSAVDINEVFTSSTNINTQYYYIYDPSLGNHGSYVTVILPTGDNTINSTANQYLQPGQAAQVAVTGPATISFNEDDKAPGNITSTSASNNQIPFDNMLNVQLYTSDNYNNGGTIHDGFGIIFNDNFDNAITNSDAIKPMNFNENFGRNHNGTYLSIEQRTMPQPSEVFPIYSNGYTNSEYTIKLQIKGLDNTLLYLDDHFTGTSTPIEAETIYSFNVDPNNSLSASTNRFSIRTEARLAIDDNSLLSGISLFPNPLVENTFFIHAPKLSGETATVIINDMLGREIYNNSHTFIDSSINIDIKNTVHSGVYIVTLSLKDENKSFQIIKQ